VVSGLDGKVALELGPEPLPLLEADFQALEGEIPGYDAVGRGSYQALRTDPDCLNRERYASLLKEGYPHYVSELASHILMLGEKDVEVPYLDRRVKLLKIFALMEPDDPHFLLEIGATLLEKGCRFSALHLSTVTLYKAESYLKRAAELAPDDPKTASTLAEVSFLLGKYEPAAALWRQILPTVGEGTAAELEARLERIAKGELPRVPAVDYLEAIAGAMALKDEGGYLEAAAILNDVQSDAFFACEFPMPEIPYLLALCCKDMGGVADARTHLRRALRMNPDFAEAQAALAELEK
jgi:tetratricopeptide (TPR) repeat protein